MERKSTFIALVITAITVSVLMFLLALIVETLGAAATPFVLFVCLPFTVLLAVFGLLFLYVCLSSLLHFFRLMRAEEDHRFKMRYELREIDLERRHWRLIEYRHQVKRSIEAARRYEWKRRRTHVRRQQGSEVEKRECKSA